MLARAMVVGASGYLGTALCARLADEGIETVRLTSQKSAAYESSNRAGRTIYWDYGSLPSELAELDAVPDAVIFLAGQTSAYRANANPVIDIDETLKPFARLLEWITQRAGPAREIAVIYSGSVTQYGFTEDAYEPRTRRDHPDTIYDLHKKFCEEYLAYYSQHGPVLGVTLRLCNVFGPGAGHRSAERGVVNQWIHSALAGKPITVFGNGNFLRDYLYIDDVIEAFLGACRCAHDLNGGAYEIGSGRGITIAAAARCVTEVANRLTGRMTLVEHVEPPKGMLNIERRNFVANPSPFCGVSGWAAHVSFEEGVEKMCMKLLNGQESSNRA